MKNSTILKMTATLAIIMLGFKTLNAQETYVSPPSTKQHGTNSANQDRSATTEAVDSVTVGATLQYYVEPDPDVNVKNALNTYTWTYDPLLITTGNVAAGANTQTITFVAAKPAAQGTIQVRENSVGGCNSAITTSIPVRVIDKPTATGGGIVAAQCSSDPTLLTFNVPITTTCDEIIHAFNTVRVNFTVKKPDNSVLFAAQDIELVRGATTFPLALGAGATTYGNYIVTINSVSDRISRKSAIAGTVTTPDITLTVNKTPVTGKIYHLPNN